MTLLFINFSLQWGGGEQWHYQHALELSRLGYTVSALVHSRSPLLTKLRQGGIRCNILKISNRSFLNPIKYLCICRIIRKENPDTVILNGSNELKLGAIACSLLGVNKILYRRGNGERILPHFFNRFLFRRITHLVANSSFVLHQLQKDFHQHLPSKQYIIPNGIFIMKDRSPIQYDTQRIAVLGRLSREKGVDLALLAFQRIRLKFPAARLVVIGEGDEKLNLMRLSDRLGMNGGVEFLGFRDQPSDILVGCSVLMIPSRWEGFSYARLEAMNLSIPVVAFGIEALKENMDGEPVIRFATPFDPGDLAEKTMQILDSPDAARTQGEAGYHHACRYYDLEKTLREFIVVMEE